MPEIDNLRDIKSTLMEYYAAQTEAIVTSFRLSHGTLSATAIHDFRVAVKHLRAFLHLINLIIPEAKSDERICPLKNIYRASGRLRDIQVQMVIVRECGLEFITGLNEYYNFLMSSEIKFAKIFCRSGCKYKPAHLKTVGKTISRELRSPDTGDIVTHVEEIIERGLNEIAAFAGDTALSMENLHNLRMKAKQTRYMLEAVRFKQPSKETSNILDENLRRIHQPLGKWRDLQLGIEMLAEFRRQHSYIEEKNEIYDRFDTILKNSSAEFLQAFYKAWDDFRGKQA